MKRFIVQCAYAIAIAAGGASWLYVSWVSGRREAWDSGLYYSLALPVLGVVAAALGFILPERAWRWGMVPFGAQALAAVALNPSGNLLPLGLVLFGILGAILAVPAYAGAFARRLVLGK